MRVAIHQPNFFPWLGYFQKIQSSDHFIFLDDVQIQKKAGSWTNRVKILSNGNPTWLTAPIRRPSGTSAVNEVEFADPNWSEKCYSQIDHAYRKCPFHSDTMKFLAVLFEFKNNLLSDFNHTAILKILEYLEIKPPDISNSSSYSVSSNSTDRLIDLIAKVGGTEYLCGGGSASYLEHEKFAEVGIDLVMQDFVVTGYLQTNTSEFVPGLSIIDSLMMNGPNVTSRMIQ